jgi:hypothetical protein
MNTRTLQCIVTLAALSFIAMAVSGCMSSAGLNPADFNSPPQSVRIHTWWHWLDGAVTKEGITKDLEAMKQAGVVQATILNIGLFDGRDFGVPQVKFNSPQWYEMFQWALQEANRLGITIGAHNCDGWSSSGGPWITPEMSMKQYVWTKTIVTGGRKLEMTLPKPYSEYNFYRDAAVFAYPCDEPISSFQSAAPGVTVNNANQTTWLTDGNPISAVAVKKGDKVLFAFDKPFTAEKIVIHPRKRFIWGNMDSFKSKYVLRASDDGSDFKMVKEMEIKGLNRSVFFDIPSTTAKYYQLEIGELSDISSDMPFNIAEAELLKANESPLYNPSIPYHLEKAVSVKYEKAEYINVLAKADHATASPDKVVELTGKMSRDGELKWDAPPGNWHIIRFGYTTTGANNNPATKEGLGLECDKMDAAAVDLHFRSFPQKLVDAAGKYAGNTFKFLFIDSWECQYQNWSENFAAEFKKRRGYGLDAWLPVLCGQTVGSNEQSEAFLYDFRKTIAELIEQNYYKHFSELCHKANIEMHAEVIYGGGGYPPLDILKSNSYADMPMWEFWANHNPKTSLPEYTAVEKPEAVFAAYANLWYDKPAVGAEAYTAQAHYSESLWDLKPFGDRAYCSGINQFILHSYVHQPFDKKPGMTLYRWGSHFNRNNLYWQHISDWFDYHARVQYVLQKGTTQPQVLQFIGDQLPQSIEQAAPYNLPAGYSAALCNLDVLTNKIKPGEGSLLMSNGGTCQLLTIPRATSMEAATLRRIAEFVDKGAVLYGPKPTSVISLGNREENSRELETLANKMWGKVDGKDITENQYGKGRVIWGKPIASVLRDMKILPDFEAKPNRPNTLLYIHKKANDADVFFVVNQLNAELNIECLFATMNQNPEIWDPEQGTVSKPAACTFENGRARLPILFKPRQSLMFVFKTGQADGFVASSSADKKQEKPEVYEIKDFKGTIEFLPEYKADIKPVEITELKSWTDFEAPAIKYFSGTAAYAIRFTPPAGFASKTDSLALSLGAIGSTAEVSLNGRKLGFAWRPDSTFDVTGLLKSDAENLLEVRVANVYRNRFIGDFIEFGKAQNIWTSAPVEIYLDKNKPLKPSGLLGPIKLLKTK